MVNIRKAETALNNYAADTKMIEKANPTVEEHFGRAYYLMAMIDGMRTLGFRVSLVNGKYKIEEKK